MWTSGQRQKCSPSVAVFTLGYISLKKIGKCQITSKDVNHHYPDKEFVNWSMKIGLECKFCFLFSLS